VSDCQKVLVLVKVSAISAVGVHAALGIARQAGVLGRKKKDYVGLLGDQKGLKQIRYQLAGGGLQSPEQACGGLGRGCRAPRTTPEVPVQMTCRPGPLEWAAETNSRASWLVARGRNPEQRGEEESRGMML
jgi:hypothetical protein